MPSRVLAPNEPGPAAISAPGGSRLGAGWIQSSIILGLILVLYHRVFALLFKQWRTDPNFSHGFFVPLLSAYLVWQSREKLARIPRQPSLLGLILVAFSMAMLVLGVLGAELFTSRVSFVVLLAGLIVYFFGWAHFRALLFPWALLLLMIPIPELIMNQVTIPLQFVASRLATWMLEALSIPVLREGNIIYLSNITLEVAQACSGIRSLISLATLAIVYGYFMERRLWARIVLLAAAVPISVVVNGFRIAGTGLTARYWNPDKALGFFHEFSGWLIFLLSLGLLFAVQALLRLAGGRAKEAANA